MVPVVSKLYCSSSEKVFVVRRRPRVVNGGGFVVFDRVVQKDVFKVDGCGILGKKEELILRDGHGNDVLLIRRKGGIVEALSLCKKWKGYTSDYEGSHQKLVFILKVPIDSCLTTKKKTKSVITVEPKEQKRHGHFMVIGDFPARDCNILDSHGDVVAQVGEVIGESRDVYQVVVKAGIDQAFVFGVIAVLDYIYDGSTQC